MTGRLALVDPLRSIDREDAVAQDIAEHFLHGIALWEVRQLVLKHVLDSLYCVDHVLPGLVNDLERDRLALERQTKRRDPVEATVQVLEDLQKRAQDGHPRRQLMDLARRLSLL